MPLLIPSLFFPPPIIITFFFYFTNFCRRVIGQSPWATMNPNISGEEVQLALGTVPRQRFANKTHECYHRFLYVGSTVQMYFLNNDTPHQSLSLRPIIFP